MDKNIKLIVSEFKRKYRIDNVTESALVSVMKQQGFAVIYFNNIFNDEDVARVIENLNLDEMIERCRGFTFANNKFRLVFINEDLSQDERILVLAHEEGHIFCGHSVEQSIIGRDVVQEHEANEFSHYLLHPGHEIKAKAWLSNHKKAVLGFIAFLIVLIIGITVVTLNRQEKKYYGEYYVTTAGNKYHEKDCIFVKSKTDVHRMTQEEFDSGKYERCQICLP